jgi:hypothetical protein
MIKNIGIILTYQQKIIFYHSGGKMENRNSIVEALVFNFEVNICKHN